jgi:hypothetical protein
MSPTDTSSNSTPVGSRGVLHSPRSFSPTHESSVATQRNRSGARRTRARNRHSRRQRGDVALPHGVVSPGDEASRRSANARTCPFPATRRRTPDRTATKERSERRKRGRPRPRANRRCAPRRCTRCRRKRARRSALAGAEGTLLSPHALLPHAASALVAADSDMCPPPVLMCTVGRSLAATWRIRGELASERTCDLAVTAQSHTARPWVMST